MDLCEFFSKHKHIALAYSGGTDSAYLLYAARSHGCDIHAYYVKSAFQPQFELNDARRLADELHTKLTILELDILSELQVVQNPADRCYYCKKLIFLKIIDAAKKDGYSILIDGTNASDDISDRPGFRAIHELSVYSPLRDAGLTKTQIRKLSKEAGLFTWNKPAYACLATRIPTGMLITKERLQTTEDAECILSDLGFSNFRIRMLGNDAKIQIPQDQFPLLFQCRTKLLQKLKPYYSSILLDLEDRT